MTFDFSKLKVTGTEISEEVQTRDGRPVKIYAVDMDLGEVNIIGAIQCYNGSWIYFNWVGDGTRASYLTCDDLIPIPKKPMRVEFEAEVYAGTVNGLGKVESLALLPLSGKKVKVTVEEIVE